MKGRTLVCKVDKNGRLFFFDNNSTYKRKNEKRNRIEQ